MCPAFFLLQLELLKLLNRLLEAGELLLGICQLLLVGRADLLRGLLQIHSVGEELLLALDALRGLVAALLGLANLGVHIDVALDVQEDSRRRGDGVGDAAGGTGGVGAEGVDLVDGLARQRGDGDELLVTRLLGGLGKGLDND